MEELVPGVKLAKLDSGDDNFLREQELLKLEILKEKADVEARRENRKIGLLTEVGIQLSKGNTVYVTQEMEDLDISLRVRELIQRAQYAYTLQKFIYEEDDEYMINPFGYLD